MYLSRVKIDTNLRSSRNALADNNRFHAMVASCFDGSIEKQRPLWRIDTLNNSTYLLIVSSEAPLFDRLLPQVTSGESENADSKDYSAFLSAIKNGETYRFRVTANPVFSSPKARDTSGRGRVYGHVTVDQQKSWLSDRAEKNGFELVGFDVLSRGIKKFNRQGKAVTLSIATFEGVLTVTNADLLRSALTNGVGRAKAYGCGLMTLARL